jgi:hypothetical protein
MDLNTFNYIDLAIKLVGLVVIVFGGGRYVGQVSTLIKQLGDSVIASEKNLAKHLEDDTVKFRDLNTVVGDIRVEVAKIPAEILKLHSGKAQ